MQVSANHRVFAHHRSVCPSAAACAPATVCASACACASALVRRFLGILIARKFEPERTALPFFALNSNGAFVCFDDGPLQIAKPSPVPFPRFHRSTGSV